MAILKFLIFCFIFENRSHQNCEEQIVLKNKCSKKKPVDCGQTSSKILVKDLIFKKAASPVTLAINYLKGIILGL